jgi:microcystin degradation protein MlrC
MARTLRGEVRPVLSAAFPPVAINIERQLTSASPCRELYAVADRQLATPGVLSNSVVLGFPYADCEEMGSSFLVVTDNDAALGQRLADELASYLWEHRADFVGRLLSIDEAVQKAKSSRGPVGLLDMGDNVGGGSPGDSTQLMHGLIAAGVERSLACLFDPQSVTAAQAAGIGKRARLSIGGKIDPSTGAPIEAEATVISLHDGKFSETETRHGGLTQYDMGPTAVVQLTSGQTLLVSSRRMAPFSLGQVTSCGLDPKSFQAIIIKGVHAPVAAYVPVCSELIRVDTPGVTRADMAKLPFHHRRKPLFPFEDNFAQK